jgi:HAD superfamily hydrolase (TIGR01484 family)
VRYLALCCDYDGTLAHDGRVDAATIAALERTVASGRRLVLVTGRELADLQAVFPKLELFERVVAENGALLYMPANREEKLLSDPPAAALVHRLRERGVRPLSVGRSIIATWEPHDRLVLDAIRELGLELQVTFNKGAVMVLPTGVNKATGLAAALDSLGLSPHNAVGIGDAENDHAFLSIVECGVAVANALPTLKDKADFTTRADHGAGVVELIDELLDSDLAGRAPALVRHRIPIGKTVDGSELALEGYGASALICGTSGSGKSTVAKGLIERIHERGYSYCVIDPEGDYAGLPDAVSLGTAEHAPGIDEAMQLLEQRANATFNLLGLPLGDRPAWFLSLLPRVLALRLRTGQPHWLIVDEAHHLLPAEARPAPANVPGHLPNAIQISVHPDLIAPAALAGIDALIVIGTAPADNVRRFANVTTHNIALPRDTADLGVGEALVWMRDAAPKPVKVQTIPSRVEHRRHHRKYAAGELPEDRSFYFRGPHGNLNLRAQNLLMFLQMADGVDDGTWDFHLRRGDYSRWMEHGIKDDLLTDRVRDIEALRNRSAAETRALVRRVIEELYTLPA